MSDPVPALPEPQEGGTYTRDPETGSLTRVGGTEPAEYPPAQAEE